MSKKYPGKLLLFGEYTVMYGGNALAMPSSEFYGNWTFGSDIRIDNYLRYLLERNWNITPNLPKIQNDISNLIFQSNIPVGYGCGSSGALTAACFERYFESQMDLNETRSTLADMESFFHGQSSGFDPLISLMQEKHLNEGGNVRSIELSLPEGLFCYIMDSKTPRSTKSLVAEYQYKMETDSKFKAKTNELLHINNDIISSWVNQASLSFKELKELSKLQYELLDFLILKDIKQVWKMGLDSGEFTTKLCGAGAGGFYLIFSENQHLEKSLANLKRVVV